MHMIQHRLLQLYDTEYSLSHSTILANIIITHDSNIMAHAHILSYILFEHVGYTNQEAKKLVSLLAVSLARRAKARSKIQNLLPP